MRSECSDDFPVYLTNDVDFSDQDSQYIREWSVCELHSVLGRNMSQERSNVSAFRFVLGARHRPTCIQRAAISTLSWNNSASFTITLTHPAPTRLRAAQSSFGVAALL